MDLDNQIPNHSYKSTISNNNSSNFNQIEEESDYFQNLPNCPTPSPSLSNTLNPEDDFEKLNSLRSKYTNNPSIGYLNINSLRGNQFSQLE